METVHFGAHHYIDLSDLNARWDQDFPGGYEPTVGPVHGLGMSNGSLSGNALGIAARGVGQDPSYPWREYSADTTSLQQELNDRLSDAGCNTLEIDGVLGPDTCAAAAAYGMDPNTCQSYGTPPVCPDEALPPSRAGIGLEEPNWLLIGAAVGLVALGGAILYTRQRR